MIVKYDAERLNFLIKNIFELSGVSISVLDTNYKVLANSSKRDDFCSVLQATKTEKKKCEICDNNILKRCSQTKKLESHICRAGLYDAAMPIIKGNHILGYIIMGRIRSKKSPDFFNYLPHTYENYDSLNMLYSQIPILAKKQLTALYNIFSEILFADAINVLYDDFINRVIEFIDTNLKENLSVDFLCKKLNVSVNYLYDSFHKNLNCTVNEYITEERINKAKELLINTDETVYNIAEEVGIYNYTYFCRLFKKINGISPNEYRKSTQKF